MAETELLIQLLSDLLRYTLYNTQDRVSLRVELQNLHSYMYIQESRFLDRLGFWIDCRVDPDRYEIPAFVLQPLVENAISHGIRPKENGGLIRVTVYEEESHIRIRVTDNGVGMDPQTLSSLRAGTYQPARQHSGIGVGNVAARLKIVYPDSEFRIFSAQGRGTCIELRYPAVMLCPTDQLTGGGPS